MGGRVVWTSVQVDELTSLEGQPFTAEQWAQYVQNYPRYDNFGCSFDGEDCSLSRCCAREGSQCYRKNAWFASCNETCLPFSKWEGHHGHGHWVHSSHQHWDCAVLPPVATVSTPHPAADPPTTAPAAPLKAQHSGDPIPPYPGRRWEFPPQMYWPHPEYFKATIYGGCQEDGLDCRYSRCCARQGSRCYLKNNHWASCNETCFPYTHWEGVHRHGSWRATQYPVWDCTDITLENDEIA